ncbi:MAG: response regulator [Roseivirga sp.]|nr:response regulator [Roseivirga sp.]
MTLVSLKSLLLSMFLWPFLVLAQSGQSHGYQQFRNELNNKSTPSHDTLISLFERIVMEEEQDLARVDWANVLVRVGDPQLADSLFGAALPGLLKGSDHTYILQAYAGKVRALQTMGKLKEGITLADQARQYMASNESALVEIPQKQLVGEIYRTTGILFAMQIGLDEQGTFNQESAEKYFRQSYDVFSNIEDYVMAGLALFNIGNVQAIEDSTIYYWQSALEVFEEHGIEEEKFNIYQNLAILHIDKRDFATALEYLNETRRLMPPNPSPFDLALYEVKLGYTYANLSRLNEAIVHLQKGLEIGLEYEMLSIQGEAYELLIGVYTEQKRFKQALETYIQYDSLNQKFEQLETERIFRETEARYKTKEQQDQIQLLRQEEILNQARISRQRLIIVIIIIFLLLIGVLGFLFWKQSKNRQLLNQQLQKLDQARKRFLVNISHELRTPVTLIHAPLEDAMSSLEKDDIPRVKNNLQKITNNTRKLLQLTEEVLDIARLDEGALQLEEESTDLDIFLNRVFFAFESLAVRNQISWTSEISSDVKYHELDRKKLERILNNLFSNAIKHTPKKGEVRFMSVLNENQLNLTIADTGKGIPEDALPRIFDRYYQASENDRTIGGLGIGLALVKELLEFMGGNIQVKSRLNEGTQFHLTIPVRHTETLPIKDDSLGPFQLSLEKRPSVDLSDKEACHILVVEDNPEMSDFIQQLLSDHYRVTLAENGIEGLERLKSGQFDLITADVMMPEMDGISFVKEIKAHHDWRNISVIMITALSDEADKIEGLRLGIDDYIPKPFSANELKARVANLIQNTATRKEASREKEEEIVGNEKQLLDDARNKVEAHLSDNSFSVTELSAHLNLSERQANRVLKKITGLSCLQFIREIRLQRAYRLLESHKYQTIAEVAYAVGFENPSYFTRIFSERFGKKPSEML